MDPQSMWRTNTVKGIAICADERKNSYYETLIIICVIASLSCSISVNALLAESFTCRGCLVQRTKVPSAKQRTANIHTLPHEITVLIRSSQLHLVADHFHLTDIAVGSVFHLYYPQTVWLLARTLHNLMLLLLNRLMRFSVLKTHKHSHTHS